MDRETWWATVHGVTKSLRHKWAHTHTLLHLPRVYWLTFVPYSYLTVMKVDCAMDNYRKALGNNSLSQTFYSLWACVLSRFSHIQLCDPMVWGLPGSSVHGILQARILESVAYPPPRDLPNPGIEPTSLMSPALASTLPMCFTTLPLVPPGKPILYPKTSQL